MTDKFKCPCCGGSEYEPINVSNNKPRYKTTTKASGLITVSKVRRVDIQVSKDFAECVSCRYRTLLSESEEVVKKETKKEAADKLAETKFNKHFLNPGGS